MEWRFIALASFSIAFGPAPAAEIPDGLKFTLESIPSAGFTSMVPTAINNAGVVVGMAFLPSGQTICFKYESGVVSTLADSVNCLDINDAADVAGTTYEGGHYVAAYWTATGQKVPVGPNGIDSWGTAINSKREVALFTLASTAYLYSGDRLIDLGMVYAQPNGINGGSEVVGSNFDDLDPWNRGFAWQDGASHEVCVAAPKTNRMAKGVNQHGRVLCEVADPNYRVFLEDKEGTQHPIPPASSHYPHMHASRMNNKGDVVGSLATDSRPSRPAAAYFSNGVKSGLLIDLVASSDISWDRLVQAADINRDRWITGWGYSGGESRAFVARPVVAK